MGVGLAGIPEERVGNPDFANHVAVEHEQLHGTVELEPAVVPRLGEEDVDGVLLQGPRHFLLPLTQPHSHTQGARSSSSMVPEHVPRWTNNNLCNCNCVICTVSQFGINKVH